MVLAHEVLVRQGRGGAAETWRQAVVAAHVRHRRGASQALPAASCASTACACRASPSGWRSSSSARWPSTASALWSDPAIEELRGGVEPRAFRQLQEGIDELSQAPAGVGFEVPRWIEALEDEVEGIRADEGEESELLDPHLPLPEVRLGVEEVRRQVRRMLEESSAAAATRG